MKRIKEYFDKYRLLILLVVVLFYGNTLKNGYSLDDSIVTQKNNLTAQGIRAIPKIITSFYIEQSSDFQFDYRPVVKISYAIEHELFGVSPTVSHFINLFLYIISLNLIFSVLKLLFSDYPKEVAFYCTILFAIMPIHTEVVSSLKNRDILLCFIFCLLGLKHFIGFIESNLKKWTYIVFTFVSFYFAFLCKLDVVPYLVITPAVVFVKHRQHLKWALIFCALFIVIFLLFRFTKNSFIGKSAAQRVYYYFENPLYFEKSIQFKIIATFNSLGFYLNQCLFPFKMCCYYGTDTIPVLKLSTHGYLGIVCAPLLLIGIGSSFIKKNYLLLTGLIIFCASVSMYLNLVKPAVGIVADRFAFFASLGVAITVVSLIMSFIEKEKTSKPFKMVSLLFIVVFAGITIKRNTDWNSIQSIIENDTPKYNNNAYLNYKKGMQIVQTVLEKGTMLPIEHKKNKLLEAKNYLEKSIQTDPNYPNSRNYLAYLLVYLLNDFNAALPHINYSIAYKETTELYYYKAICMREIKQKDSSEYYLLKCIKMDNKYYNAYGLLAYDYNLNKQHQKSIDLFKDAIEKGVKTLEIYNALGKTYWEIGNNTEANIYYQKALEIDPSNQEAAAMVKRTSAIKDTSAVQ